MESNFSSENVWEKKGIIQNKTFCIKALIIINFMNWLKSHSLEYNGKNQNPNHLPFFSENLFSPVTDMIVHLIDLLKINQITN